MARVASWTDGQDTKAYRLSRTLRRMRCLTAARTEEVSDVLALLFLRKFHLCAGHGYLQRNMWRGRRRGVTDRGADERVGRTRGHNWSHGPTRLVTRVAPLLVTPITSVCRVYATFTSLQLCLLSDYLLSSDPSERHSAPLIASACIGLLCQLPHIIPKTRSRDCRQQSSLLSQHLMSSTSQLPSAR